MKRLIPVLFLLAYSCSIPTLYATVRFTGPELLGRPTDNSITVNVVADTPLEVYFEYDSETGGGNDGYHYKTTVVSATANEPIEAVLSGLAADTRYYYRMVYREVGAVAWIQRAEHSFHTQRTAGSSFTFTITADSHLGQYGGQTAGERALYAQTLQNVGQDNPDFHLDLGDTAAMDPTPLGTGMTEAEADAAYQIQRPYLGLVFHSIPYFFVLGNHENEEGWNFDDAFAAPDQSLAIVGLQARKKYFPNPIPDGFYSGNEDPLPQAIGGDTYREDYYAWEWGDALFVVIDPYQYSMLWPGGSDGYGGEGQDGEAQGNRWDWSLGIKQYLWLKATLENSKAAYKFVFSHQVTGGSTYYGRGGAEAAPYFEWGGRNEDGSWGFDIKRPAVEGWDQPIHQLMASNGVSAFIHGHDHIYAHEEYDGMVYLECPKPDDAGYDWQPYGYGHNEGLYPNAIQIQNSGHIRVSVSPDEARVEYVRSYLPGNGTNGVVAHSFTIPAAYRRATYALTVSVNNANCGITSPAAGAHSYGENRIVSVTAMPSPGYVFDHWTGDVANARSASTTVTLNADKSITAHFIVARPGVIAYLGAIGTAASKTADTSLVINTTAAVDAGNAVILAFASDPYQNLTVSVADTAGNSYQPVANAICYQHIRNYIFAAYDVKALPAGSAITLTISSPVTARAAVAGAFRGLAAGNPLDQSLGYPIAGANMSASGASPAAGPTGTITEARELLISAIATEGPVEDNAGSWDYSFIAGPRTGTTGGTAATNVTVALGYRIATVTAEYAVKKSNITSRYWAAAIASFKTSALPSSGRSRRGSTNIRAVPPAARYLHSDR